MYLIVLTLPHTVILAINSFQTAVTVGFEVTANFIIVRLLFNKGVVISWFDVVIYYVAFIDVYIYVEIVVIYVETSLVINISNIILFL